MNTSVLLRRLTEAATTIPRRRHWLETGVAAASFAIVATPIAVAGGLVSLEDGFAIKPGLALRTLVLPALVEETLFRVLPNHHPRERRLPRTVVVSGAFSLTAYVLAHPLAALALQRGEVLLRPSFLLLTALLGTCCLLLYRRSGSMWPPVILHWLVVFGWLSLGGEGILRARG